MIKFLINKSPKLIQNLAKSRENMLYDYDLERCTCEKVNTHLRFTRVRGVRIETNAPGHLIFWWS